MTIGRGEGMTKDEKNKEKKILTQKIAERVYLLRKRQGLSQEAVELEADLADNYLGLVENGKKCPTIYTCYRIAKALRVSLPELVDFEKMKTDDETEFAIQRLVFSLRELPPDKIIPAISVIENMLKLGK